MIHALELGWVNVAARGLGLARSAFDHAIANASERETFGRPIADHQSIQIELAQMATKIRAAELLVLDAAERKETGERADLQVGMARAPTRSSTSSSPGGSWRRAGSGEAVVVAAGPRGVAVRRPADRPGRVAVDRAAEVVVEPVERETLDGPRDARDHRR